MLGALTLFSSKWKHDPFLTYQQLGIYNMQVPGAPGWLQGVESEGGGEAG